MSEHAPLSNGNCVTLDCAEHPFVVDASDGSSFSRNSLRFADAHTAARYANDLAGRWTSLRAYKVVDTRSGWVEREVKL